ncbi:signal peptidase II [Pseudogracilibacillus auburnensis]|uniref:signal peptidase II n=1 Tax=Pseudogracilibacillus auburnensis TaxID=1494959 RepID=UPI001A968961|nr:signal peptidase II [Pseudogracilibacillus auburnensis]MBO1004954.1 signal peptidase II [Pseudogracilibacillus auburnensis]
MYYIIALIIVALDQITKWKIVESMEQGQSIVVIQDLFYITSHRNRGAAWGILQDQMWLFYIITIIVAIGIVYYLEKHAKGKPLFQLSLAFILGGAIGNFIDRLFRKEVVDFLDTYIFSYDFPIFNIADAALTIGVVLMFIQMIIESREEKRKTNEQV